MIHRVHFIVVSFVVVCLTIAQLGLLFFALGVLLQEWLGFPLIGDAPVRAGEDAARVFFFLLVAGVGLDQINRRAYKYAFRLLAQQEDAP